MKKSISLLVFIISAFAGFSQPAWIANVVAGDINMDVREYNVAKYGVKPNTGKVVTKLVQQAIDVCAKAGGGKVVFTAGT